MKRLLTALLQIGADPKDDEDQRLRRVLVLAAVLMVMPAALVWGAILKGRATLGGSNDERYPRGATARIATHARQPDVRIGTVARYP